MDIVWFKRDLRLDDHRPLVDAAASGDCEESARSARQLYGQWKKNNVEQVETQRVIQQHASRKYRRKKKIARDDSQLRLFQ